MIELLSIDLSNYCSKQCNFCYNHSTKQGNVMWKPQEVIAFCIDCIKNGVRAVSLGGGEPFEYDGVFDIIDALYNKCYISVTTNGLPLLNNDIWCNLMLHKPDKIHITIHQPDNAQEVDRVSDQIIQLQPTGIKPGVNLLVDSKNIEAAHRVYRKLSELINTDQIIIIPKRFYNTPTPKQLAEVADRKPFQSPSCLLGCKRPLDFASVSWDKKVNSCSYAPNKERLESLDYKGMISTLEKIKWNSCNKSDF